MKKTLKQFLTIADTIDKVRKICGDIDVDNTFMFKTMKISSVIDKEYRELQEIIEPSREYREYLTMRNKLLFDRAVYSIENKQALFETENKLFFGDGEPYVLKESEDLSNKYRIIIEEQLMKENLFNEKLDEEIELELPTIKLDTVPKGIKWDTFEWFFDFIEE